MSALRTTANTERGTQYYVNIVALGSTTTSDAFDATRSRILLVQSRFTGKWGFTKGHAETWDINPLETATREVKEEAGYLEVIHYKITEGPILLRGRPYWTAVLRTDETPTLNRLEQSGIGWFRLKEIPRLRLNEDVRLYLAISGT